MAWHISLSHRILRERWEDYWCPATGIRLDFLSNHWNMWLYKEGLHRLGLVLTQNLTTWKQHGTLTKDWRSGHVRKPFLQTLSCWFLEGDDLHEALQDGAGQECCAGALWTWSCINIFSCLATMVHWKSHYQQAGLACQSAHGPRYSHCCDFLFCIMLLSPNDPLASKFKEVLNSGLSVFTGD